MCFCMHVLHVRSCQSYDNYTNSPLIGVPTHALLFYIPADCKCPDNLVQDGNRCVLPTECPNSQCLLPPDVGNGKYVQYLAS